MTKRYAALLLVCALFVGLTACRSAQTSDQENAVNGTSPGTHKDGGTLDNVSSTPSPEPAPIYDDMTAFITWMDTSRISTTARHIVYHNISMNGYSSSTRSRYSFDPLVMMTGDGTHFLIDESGNTISAGYYFIDSFSGKYAPACDYSLKWGAIDREGHEVVPMMYDNMTRFLDGTAGFGVYDYNGDLKWGIVDESGNELVPAQYDQLDPLGSDLFLAVVNGNDCGVIDKNGEVVVPFEYSYNGSWLRYISNGLLQLAKQEGVYVNKGFVNLEGYTVVPFEFNILDSFSEGLAAAGNEWFGGDRNIGYIDDTGTFRIPCQYAEAGRFRDGKAIVAEHSLDGGKSYAVIDISGNTLMSLPYDYVNSYGFSNGFLSVGLSVGSVDESNNLAYGGINENGDIIIPIIYDTEVSFSSGLASVRTLDESGAYKYGFINQKNEFVIPQDYDAASSFSASLAPVGKRDESGVMKYGLIDTRGMLVLPLEYDKVEVAYGGRYVVIDNGNYCGFFENPYYSR